MMVLGARGTMGYVLGRGAGTAAENGLLTGLVGYWGLDEASGNALDKHSGGLTLTQTNSPGANTGKVYATARTFVYASSQYFFRASQTALQSGAGSFAWAAWVYFSDFGNSHFILSKRAGDYTTTTEYILARTNAGGCILLLGNGGSVQSTPASSYNYSQWALIMAWFDSTNSTINLAIDNGTPYSQAFTGTPLQAAGPFVIGGYATQSLYQGRIGPVAMWKGRTLDATARTALWNGGAGLAYSSFTA